MPSSAASGATRVARVSVVRSSVQSAFAARLRQTGRRAQTLVIASPWISVGTANSHLSNIVGVVRRYGIPTYVFSRSPATESHRLALELLADCPSAEIVLNQNLHAKVYACLAPSPYGFALLASANLTSHSDLMYEVGLMVLATGGGEAIVKELASFGLDYLRTRPESIVLKRLSTRRIRNGP